MIIKLPIQYKDIVYHIGTLDSHHKSNYSMEGPCVSVSEYPSAWRRIAKLGDNPRHRLYKEDSAFIDALKVAKYPSSYELVQDWAIDRGLASIEKVYRVQRWDDEFESFMHQFFLSPDEAEFEAYDDPDKVTTEQHIVLTEKLAEQMGWNRGNSILSTFDGILIAIAREYEEQYDGVWWDEDLKPEIFSAPRGCITPENFLLWNILED